jgi:Tfp pilus assembly protein PilE
VGAESTVRNAWPSLIAVAVLLLVVFGIVLPCFNGTRHDYRGTEAKANLHSIQLAIERYAVDHEGIYPSYLIGGQALTAQSAPQADGTYSYWYEPSEQARASDVLIREGYLPEYPANPFAKARDRAETVLAMQRDVRTSITGDDPLRPDTPEAAIYGTRFGADGRLMGQVLCDPRFPTWSYVDGQTGTVEEHDSWANIEYQFWDMWLDPKGREPYLPFSPGQFFYKSAGWQYSEELAQVSSACPVAPEKTTAYMLGAYGSLRTKGKDILGEEQTLIWFVKDEASATGSRGLRLWPWTRSQLSPTARQGSPYSVVYDNLLWYGNSNGVSDSNILVLEGGHLPGEG